MTEKHICEPMIVFTPNPFWRGFREEVPWFPIAVTFLILVMLTAGAAGIYLPIQAYRKECHGQGGHIITPRSDEICVDRENRVIIL